MPDAGSFAWWAAIAGLAAPLTIGSFVHFAGRRRARYNAWRAPISELGDGTDGVADGFVAVNIAVGVLLAVFGIGVGRSLELPAPIAWLILAAALASAVIGLTACRDHCSVPGRAGTSRRWLRWLHGMAAVAIVQIMVVVPFITWWHLRAGDDEVPLRIVSMLIPGPVAAFAGLAVISLQRSRRGSTGRFVLPGLYERLAWIAGYTWVVVAATSMAWPDWAWWAAISWLTIATVGVVAPRSHLEWPPFALDECQEGTLRSLGGVQSGRLLGYRITDEFEFERELRRAVDADVLRGIGSPSRGFTIVAGFTYAGLERLGVAYVWGTKSVADPFELGMAKRAGVLGDVDASAPAEWDPQWTDVDWHVVFWIQASSERLADRAVDTVTGAFASLAPTLHEVTHRLERDGRSTEHFGFVDGIGQPSIESIDDHQGRANRGGGKLVAGGKWRPLALGEFVLGQIDEGGDVFPVPEPREVFEGGTFMVVRKLEQDVARFVEYVRRGATDASLHEDDFAAKLIGRRRDGRPLARLLGHGADWNLITYGHDAHGRRCPLGAHIRRVNPRDSFGSRTVLVDRRRIIRRGMSYGPPYAPGDPASGRGLLFVCFNVRIAEQFEFIQRQWLNDGRPFGLATNPDPVAGHWPEAEPRTLLVEGSAPSVAPLERFVRTRGGEYFFVPSLRGLSALSTSVGGRADPGQDVTRATADRRITAVVGDTGSRLGERDHAVDRRV